MNVHVSPEDWILEAVEDAGFEPDFGCRGGVCGRCKTTVITADGDILHNDEFLTDKELESSEHIMICISGSKGRNFPSSRKQFGVIIPPSTEMKMSFTINSETCRDDFTYYNSPEAIHRFPFPLTKAYTSH